MVPSYKLAKKNIRNSLTNEKGLQKKGDYQIDFVTFDISARLM